MNTTCAADGGWARGAAILACGSGAGVMRIAYSVMRFCRSWGVPPPGSQEGKLIPAGPDPAHMPLADTPATRDDSGTTARDKTPVFVLRARGLARSAWASCCGNAAIRAHLKIPATRSVTRDGAGSEQARNPGLPRARAGGRCRRVSR
jgi:hypothetical protein